MVDLEHCCGERLASEREEDESELITDVLNDDMNHFVWKVWMSTSSLGDSLALLKDNKSQHNRAHKTTTCHELTDVEAEQRFR